MLCSPTARRLWHSASMLTRRPTGSSSVQRPCTPMLTEFQPIPSEGTLAAKLWFADELSISVYLIGQAEDLLLSDVHASLPHAEVEAW